MVTETRFKGRKPKVGVCVAIRADESLSRRVVLRQGDYSSGRYGTQYGAGVFSPYMDLSVKDLWTLNNVLGLDSNEIYSMYYDAGVPLMEQRIGSPVNVHAKDSVKLFKVLNPDTYSKMIGRLDGLDFVASYGGVYQNGFKYINLRQPDPFFSGILSSDTLVAAINYLALDYHLRDATKSQSDAALTRIRNSATEPVSLSMNIELTKGYPTYLRELAAQKAEAAGDTAKATYFRSGIPKKKTWYDYTKQLVNNAEPMFQRSWGPKFITSIKHWAKTGSAVSEQVLFALRVLDCRKDYSFTPNYPEPMQEGIDWALAGYADLSHKPIIKFFQYPQNSAENMATEYLTNIADRWNEGGEEEYRQNAVLRAIMEDGYQWAKNGAIPAQRGLVQKTKLKDIRAMMIDGTELESEYGDEEEAMPDALKEVARVIFHDDVRASANWKRTTIACLRGDCKLTYLGFGQSQEEREIRNKAQLAFGDQIKKRNAAMRKAGIEVKEDEVIKD